MRKLQFQDGFKLARIIKKSDVKEKLSEKLQSINNVEASKQDDKFMEQVGMDMIFTLIEAAGSEEVESEVYELLSGIFEEDKTKVKEMSFDELILKLKAVQEMNNLTDFFKKALNLM